MRIINLRINESIFFFKFFIILFEYLIYILKLRIAPLGFGGEYDALSYIK